MQGSIIYLDLLPPLIKNTNIGEFMEHQGEPLR